MRTLKGDRDIEWGFCKRWLDIGRPKVVIDIGSDTGTLSRHAAQYADKVFAVDLSVETSGPDNVIPIVGDASKVCRGMQADCIVNCSTMEHVGLAGRYGVDEDDDDADLTLMRVLHPCLTPGEGVMLLVCPVGADAVWKPFHRVYGEDRLPRLLDGWKTLVEDYSVKDDDATGWRKASRSEALAGSSSESHYGIGCFVITPEGKVE